MSNGGYKGSTPARETSPEQYPGVWELTEQFQAQADGNWPFQETDCAPKSLRFDGNNAKLSRTPAVSGSSSMFTLSCWVKRTLATSYDELLSIDPQFGIRFTNTNKLHVDLYAPDGSSWAVIADSKAIFRDPTAWYSIILVLDSSAGTTNADRLKLWVNGQPFEFDFTTYWGGLITGNVAKLHTVVEHTIGMRGSSLSGDFLIADYHLIDGQALLPTDFGFYDGQNIWQPKRFTGDYSSGAVWSNLVQGTLDTTYGNSSAAVPFNGSTGSNYSDGIRPNNGQYLSIDFGTQFVGASTVKIYGHASLDGVSYNGANENLKINGTALTSSQWADNGGGTGSGQQSATFTLASGLTSLEWGYSSGSQSTGYLYLQGIEVDGVLLTDASIGRNSFHLDFADSSSNAALGYDSSGVGNDWTPNNLSAVGSNQSQVWSGNVSGGTSPYGAKTNAFDGSLSTFASPAPSSPMTYTNPAPANTVISTFEIYGRKWSTATAELNDTDISSQISTTIQWHTITGFTGQNFSKLYWAPTSGGYEMRFFAIRINGTVLVDSNLSDPFSSDSLVDSPVNGNQTDPSGLGGIVQGNYATLNPLHTSVAALSNGNLLYGGGSGQHCVGSTFAVKSGKWYWESTVESGGNYYYTGIADSNTAFTTNWCGSSTGWSVSVNSAGNISHNNTENHGNIGTSASTGQVWGWALDMDAGTLKVYINGVIQYSGNSIIPSSTSLSGRTITPATGHDAGRHLTYNFGQRAFKYPLAGYKSLCTSNLPEPSIRIPSQYFDTKLWTGNSSTQTISGYGFSPDFAWIKVTSETGRSHFLFDTIRGATNVLKSDAPDIEQAYSTSLTAFNSDGFDLGAWANVNNSTKTIVGWAWDAGEATTTIAAGSLNSSAYDQSQDWTSLLTSSAGTISNASNSFDGSTSTTSQLPGTSPGSYIQFGVTLNNVTKLEIYQRSNSDISGAGIQTYSNAPAAQWVELTLTSSTVSNIRLEKNTNDPGIYAIRVNGALLVDSGVSVTNVPSIASTVRSSPESGFSIVTYTGGSSTPANSDSGDSFGHGLGASPKLVICKKRTGGNSWPVYHASTALGALVLDGDNAIDTASYLFAQKHPTSSVVYLGNNPEINNSSDNYVAYCFAPVEGYSAFGSYTGSSAFPFVYTGFKTRWVMMKVASLNHAGSWVMYDTTRDTASSGEGWLYANSTSSEQAAATYAVHTTSNGFRLAGTSNENNGSGRTYIYAAFAESPFKNARAR